MDSPEEDERTTTATETTTPATSPPRSAEIYDSAAYNLNGLSPIRSPRTGPFLPEFQRTQSSPSLFAPPRANFDRRTAYPRWSRQPQLPSSELFPQALVRPSFSAAQASQIAIRPYDPALLNQIGYQTDPCNKRNFVSQYLDTDAAANLYQSSPLKSRKKASDDDDSKCCYCKKTRCLKLYCECFASGLYCTKACGCQDCYNTLDYEDTVQASRELIENRNPLAFVPKGDGIDSTPSSERHKRGCNCKKTRCQKKYCECHQSKTGCTSGCGCDGCENVYGKKGDYRKRMDMLSRGSIPQISGIPFDEKLQMEATEDCLPQTELYKLYNFSSLTPPSQFQYLQSPASNLYTPNGKSPQNYQNFENSPTLPKSRNYSEGGYVPKMFGLQNSDMADSLSLEYGFPNSFDQNRVFNNPSSPIPSSGYLPFSDSQFTQIQPGNGPMQTDELDVSVYFKYEDDNHAVLDSYTPLREVKSLSSSEKSFPTPACSPQVSSSSTSSGGAPNVQLRSVPLFPPLTPLVDPKGHSSNEIKDDSTNKRRRSREVFL